MAEKITSFARFRRRSVAIQTLLGMLILAPLALAEGEKERFTPEHVAKLRGVTSAVISPDGQSIAYTLGVPRRPFEDESGRAWVELHVVDLDGSSRPFITGEANVGAIAWTPDGKGVSFLAKRGNDEHKSLYVIPIDGGEARRVLEHATDITEYSWSPDGKRVVFVAEEESPEDLEELEEKGFNAHAYEEDHQPVRVWVGVTGDEDAESEPLDLPGAPSDLVWSPVGNQVAMALAPTPHIDDHYMKRKLHVVDAESGEVVAEFSNPGKLGKAAWSPDGKYLAFRSAEDLHDPSAGRLVVADPSDRSLTDILPNFLGQVESIVWQDNTTIMYLASEGVWTTLCEIQLHGSNKKTHVPVGKAALQDLSLSKDGQAAAMLSQSPAHPGEVFVMRHGDSGPRRLTETNPWLANMEFADQKPIQYTAKDGLVIDAILIEPLGAKSGQKYPLILHVHGGPEAHYSNGWMTRYSMAGQVGAAEGFAVLYPNYRGSTGRGVKFSKGGQADYGGKEFDDLIDGVDYLIEKGLVDADRVGVTGGSYGGFATAWCSTYHSKRFAAGVMFVGISDHISKAGTTDIPDEMTLVHAQKRIWDDWDFFTKRSPIYYVRRSKTPLLILHGEEDTRVHPSQSLELYRHLKVLGKTPVRLITYPGEGHGNRKSAGRYDYNLRMMRWMKHYLQGSGGDAPPYTIEYPLQPAEDEEEEVEEDTDDEN